MEPLDVLTEYFLGQLHGRYRKPKSIPRFKAFRPQSLLNSLLTLNDMPSQFYTTVERHFAALERQNAQMICLGDPRYPPLLLHTPDPPWALNVVGNPVWLKSRDLAAVIGSRKAPPHSLRAAFELGAMLVKQRSGVVSGGAFGCDIAAHHGSLATGIAPLSAVVILAGGPDHFYPRTNADVFADIIDHGGAIVSERLCGYVPRHYDFPIRNRIIAGLCSTIYVVSAGRRSGAMITAQRGLDYGRDIFVLTPEKKDIRHDGMKDLLFDGAMSFSSVTNLVERSPGYV